MASVEPLLHEFSMASRLRCFAGEHGSTFTVTDRTGESRVSMPDSLSSTGLALAGGAGLGDAALQWTGQREWFPDLLNKPSAAGRTPGAQSE
jgi:hypothetical protein